MELSVELIAGEAATSMVTTVRLLVGGLEPTAMGRPGIRKTSQNLELPRHFFLSFLSFFFF